MTYYNKHKEHLNKYAKTYNQKIIANKKYYCKQHDTTFSSNKRLTMHLQKHKETKQNEGLKDSYIKTLALIEMLNKLEIDQKTRIEEIKKALEKM